MAQQTTHSTCYACTTNCPITVVSDGGVIASIDHPACVRATGMREQREHASRIIHPILRDRVGGAARTVTIAQALAHTTHTLREVRARHGAAAVAFAAGYTKEARPYLQRLCYLFGSPHYLTESSCCFSSGYVAAAVTLGKEYGYLLVPARARSPATRCRLVWSNNPEASQIPYACHHLLADASSVPTIVVDPRSTSLARAARIHLQPRPGTDGALALGLAHVMLAEGLHDRAFVARHAHGFEDFRRYTDEFPPAQVAAITGIPPERIVEAARLYATHRPAQITISPNATTHHTNGFQNHRAILLLAALTGNLGIEGGNRPWLDRVEEKDVTLHDELLPGLSAPVGAQAFPVFVAHYDEAQGMVLAEAIERGEIRALVGIGLNVMMWPSSSRLRRALERLDVFATSDFFSNPTTDAASVVFPAATHLERQALIVGGNGRIQYRPAAVPPRGEAIGDTELVFALARGLGLESEFWGGDIARSYDERLARTPFRFADLPPNGESVRAPPPRAPERGHEVSGFGTPTGKVEFVSTTLERYGLAGLPRYEEPYWSPVRTPELFRDYPLVLTSGGRSNVYTHSQGRELAALRTLEPDPRVQLHPDDARARGIEAGDWVEISSPLGCVRMRAMPTNEVQRGVVHAPHGWASANINELIPDAGLDPISGFPPFKSSLCQVRRSSSTVRVAP